MLTNAAPDGQLVLVYELPALTTFQRLAVPEVTVEPPAYVTFFREVTVSGSAAEAVPTVVEGS